MIMYKKIRHVFLMLSKNLKTYIALSITIVLSFSIFLGYMMFIDTKNYNDYKEIFSAPPNIVLTNEQFGTQKTTTVNNMLKEKNIQTSGYSYLEIGSVQPKYGELHFVLKCLPGNLEDVYEQADLNKDVQIYSYVKKLELTMGRTSFALSGNEAIINESLYAIVGANEELPFDLNVQLQTLEGDAYNLCVSVVGVCEDGNYISGIFLNERGHLEGAGNVYVNQSIVSDIVQNNFATCKYQTVYITDEPEQVADCISSVGLVGVSVAEAQNEARKEIQVQKQTKAIVLIMLMVILGVNMFGSMSNVISKRQYEIGIKRAIGVRAKDIVVQFFLESLSVMLIDMLMSVLLVVILATGYKLFLFVTAGEILTIYLTIYSIWLFLVACAAIMLIFSIFLAYKATQVEIVKQLKFAD